LTSHLKTLKIDDIILSHEDQAISLKGTIKDRTNKDLKLSFKDVDLYKITPKNNQSICQGNINEILVLNKIKDLQTYSFTSY
jgi:polysaccharide pyruvyl transferase WcaK-like protein